MVGLNQQHIFHRIKPQSRECFEIQIDFWNTHNMFEKDKIKECLSRGIDYHQAGQLEKAQKLYEKVLNKEETNPDALNLLGVISLQTANPQ